MKQLAVFAVSVVMSSAPAFANTSSAFAEMSGFKIELFDTNLNDGISPYINFAANPTGTSTDPFSLATTYSGENYGNKSGSGFGSTSASSSSALSQASASTIGNGSAGGSMTMTASGSSSKADSYGALATSVGSFYSLQFPGMGPTIDAGFKLSPNTMLSISALGSASVHVGGNPGQQGYDFVTAASSIAIRGTGTFVYDQVGVSLFGAGDESLANVPMLAQFTNDSNSEFVGGLLSWASVSARQAAMVPEPSTYALMLAGLGVIVFVQRRRAQRPG